MEVTKRHEVRYVSNAACFRLLVEGTLADFITKTKDGDAIIQWKEKLYILKQEDFDSWDKVG